MKYRHDDKGFIRPHIIVLPYTTNNTEIVNIIAESYVELTENVNIWILENISPYDWDFSKYGGEIAFTHKEDAMAFMLRWS